MRCAATVTKQATYFRNRNHDPQDLQCNREAVKLGMCGQHYARAYAAHRRVLARILAIPPHD